MYNMCPIGVRGNKLKGYNKFNVFIYIHNIYIYVRNIYVSYIYIYIYIYIYLDIRKHILNRHIYM